MNPEVAERLAIIRRIAERGQWYCSDLERSREVDLFQHILDELELLQLALNKTAS